MRKVIKVLTVAGLMGWSLSGCGFIKGFFRIDANECKKWVEHVDEVVVGEVKKAATKGCKLDADAVKEHIEDWVQKDCTSYDNNQTFRRRDFDCMMKADSTAAIDKCYDGIPTTTSSTSTKKIGKTTFVKKQKKQNTTMTKPQLAKWVSDEADIMCAGGGGDADDDGKADDDGDKKKKAKKDDDE